MCDSYRSQCLDDVDGVRRKLEALPEDSHIRAAVDEPRLEGIKASILDTPDTELEGKYWPPIYLFLRGRSMADIEELDADIDLVYAQTPHKHQKGSVQFLRSDLSRDWSAGTFEIFTKSRCLRALSGGVSLDYELESGKDVDLRVSLDGQAVCLECSALTLSDSDRKVWDAHWKARAAGYKGNLVRPGVHDQGDGKGLDDAYEVVRIYDKVYDKMAPGFDVDRGQLSPVEPNVYLLSWGQRIGGLPAECHFDFAIPWAFDEIFTASLPRPEPVEEGQFDTSLRRWFDIRAGVLAEHGKLDISAYEADRCGYHERLQLVRKKLSGVLLFNGLELRQGRIHYNSDEQWGLSHRQMALLTEILSEPPAWVNR